MRLRLRRPLSLTRTGLILLMLAGLVQAGVHNLKVVTDASPDYSDLPGMVHSITSRWPTTREKCWAMFHWLHKARRQTAPMHLHGLELTDPVRQFNDYGFTMCSTIAGVNCAIWHQMGLPVRYWDITLHTVPECFYDGRWHMYDSSMSALYTLCDGKTIAGVEDIGKEGACEASGGRTEAGHIARYHCLNATSPNGFLTGADCNRDLAQEHRCFRPNGLKHRYYFHDWDYGHRYILNLPAGAAYTRHYRSRGDGAEWFVPNRGKDPELTGKYGLRGNGLWTFAAPLTAGQWRSAVHDAESIAPADGGGLRVAEGAGSARTVFKVQGANVITSQMVRAGFRLAGAGDTAAIAVSADNGLAWRPVWKADRTGDVRAEVKLIDEVNGAYEVLVRVELEGKGAVLGELSIETRTMLNAKTQPRLDLGRNLVYVGAGDAAESIVLWPELQGGRYKQHVVEEQNIACDAKHIGYQGVVWAAEAGKPARLVYRIDAPRDLTRVTYGGRFYNRAPGSRIDLAHSLDGGKTWTPSWNLTDTKPPWDVIHYETVPVPPGHRSVWVRYELTGRTAGRDACSLYAVRIEANGRPADPQPRPVEVTFTWSEPQADRSLVRRSHTRRVEKLPAVYPIHVGGADHPVMESLRVRLADEGDPAPTGYSDGKDVGGEKFVGRWLTVGRNLALGRAYTMSVPSATNWGAGDPDGRKLTDGVVGPPYSGGTSYRWSAIWPGGKDPEITLDLGRAETCAVFGMNFHGYPWWDALKGEVRDEVEVLVSTDGAAYTSLGRLKTDLRRRDIPVNHMLPDHETLQGHTFRLEPPDPVQARYVRYRVRNRRFFACTELEVLDSIRRDPFDLRIALPADAPAPAR